jgi:hypothetical protein
MTTAAAIDRLVHHSVIQGIPSFRRGKKLTLPIGPDGA